MTARASKAYYPVNLDLGNKPCLVVGGGKVGGHKAKSLLAFGASVTVIAPEAGTVTGLLCRREKIRFLRRRYVRGDLRGFFLVIAATDDPRVNERVAREAMSRQMLVNVADVPDQCNFILPSVFRDGPLVVGVSTAGQCPVAGQKFRDEIRRIAGVHYGKLVRLLGAFRPEIQQRYEGMTARKAVYHRVLAAGVLDLIEQRQDRQAKQLVERIVRTNTSTKKERKRS